MRQPLRALLLVAAAALVPGCGGSSSAPVAERATVAAPHGGAISPLPGNRGYGESLIEPGAKPGTRPTSSAIVVYFLGPDGKSPMAPTPSGVSLSYTADRMPKTLNLAHRPKTDDPAGAGRFATDPVPLTESRLEGELTATIEGESVTLPVAIR
jgi:hypothetical protein